MKFNPPLIEARLIRRYKRFLADVLMSDGSEITVHTPNTGAMTGCSIAGNRVWLRHIDNSKRKYPYSWEMSEGAGGVLIGVHTGITTKLVREAIEGGLATTLQGYRTIRQEVPYGANLGSRIDLLLQDHPQYPDCYLEIKSVTAADNDGIGFFPDAPSKRALKHLDELSTVVKDGGRGVLLFCVQRGDLSAVRAAGEVDPRYAEELSRASAAGVEMLAYGAEVSPSEVDLTHPLEVITSSPP